MKTFQKTILLLISIIFCVGCSKDDGDVVNERETITTVTITLTSLTNSPSVILQSRDLDGDGPNAPIITVSGPINAFETYKGSIVLLNESVNPLVTVNDEIMREGTEHQVFFELVDNGAPNLTTFEYADFDSNDNPIGLQFDFFPANSGNYIFTLKHLLNKNGAGVMQGQIENSEGQIDIQVIFPILIV